MKEKGFIVDRSWDSCQSRASVYEARLGREEVGLEWSFPGRTGSSVGVEADGGSSRRGVGENLGRRRGGCCRALHSSEYVQSRRIHGETEEDSVE